MFGSRASDEVNWQGHDPADLVDNLAGVDLWLYTATGQPGPYDSGPPNPDASGIELATHGSTEGFAQRAQEQGVPFHLVDYTYGTHTWPYWARDLTWYLPHTMATFAESPPAPSRVSYESIDSNWSQWGWSVAVRRNETQQFSALTSADPNGFTLHGTGTATVTTPPYYRPGAVAVVTISGQPSSTVKVDSTGRLEITVPLGLDIPTPAIVGVPVQPGRATTVTIAPG